MSKSLGELLVIRPYVSHDGTTKMDDDKIYKMYKILVTIIFQITAHIVTKNNKPSLTQLLLRT